MKKGKSNTPALLIMLVLVAIIFYLITRLQDPKVVKVPVPTPMVPPRRITSIRRSPEYRDPPVKLYKPGDVQQMGVLLGENEETLPLYGKEVRGASRSVSLLHIDTWESDLLYSRDSRRP